MGILDAAVAAVLQVLVFTAVPFAAYVLTRRGVRGFHEYIGLYRPESRTVWLAVGLAAVIAPVMLGILSTPGLREMALAPVTASGQLRQLGWSGAAAASLVLNAWIQTSLSEEILFRGFLGRRLIHRLGFHAGNVLQALIFAAVHVALFLGAGGQELTLARAAFLIVPVGLNGWMLGYIKERAGNGSIIPGWIAHGLGNFTANATIAFLWK